MASQVTTLEHIAAYLPPRRVSVEEAGRSVGLNRFQARMFRRIHGLDQVSSNLDVDMFEMVTEPARALLSDRPGVASSIRYLIYAHSISDLTPAALAAAERLREALNLVDTDAFAITHVNCVSGLEAVDLAGELLRAGGDPDARALVLTGENPAPAVVRLIVNVGLLAHAATACLVGLDGTGGRVRSYAVRTDGRFADGLLLDAPGRAVFEDTYTAHVLDVVDEALSTAGIGLDDLTMVVPHNVNMSSWLRLCGKLGLARERVFLANIPRYAHAYSADLFLNLVTMREAGLLVAGGRYLLVTVGLGATYAAMVVEF